MIINDNNESVNIIKMKGHGGDIYDKDIDLDFSVNTNPCADRLLKLAAQLSGTENGLELKPAAQLFGTKYDPEGNKDLEGKQATEENQYPDIALTNYTEAFLDIYKAAAKGLENTVQYPDPYCRKLSLAIAELENASQEHIICGNGASELFMAIVHAVRPEKALVLAPCYSGYEYALGAAGAEIQRHYLKEENGFCPDEDILDKLTDDTDIFVIANPNNPTGRLIAPELLDKIKERCCENNILLVLDECFFPLAYTNQEIQKQKSHVNKSDNIIRVRAFTKTMSIPGIRLGYAICENEILNAKIRKQLPEWNVSSIAQEAGKAAAKLLKETDFMEFSREYIKKERSFLETKFKELGIKAYDSDVNYILLKPGAGVYEKLLAKKILVRDCSNFEGLGPEYIRIAVKTHEENKILSDIIKRTGLE